LTEQPIERVALDHEFPGYTEATRTRRLGPGHGSGGSPPNGTVISSWEYAYDDVGNVTSQTDKDSLVTSYTYDDIYQLTAVDYPSGSDFGYEYDAVGNRLKMYEYTSSTITTTYRYDDADELTQWTTSTLTMSFGYASDGCLVSKSDGSYTWTYDWDYERRLAAFKKNGASLVEYTFNPTGTRRQASDATLGVENYFCAGKRVLGDYDCNWGLETSYLHGTLRDEILCMLDRTTDPDTAHYFTSDRSRSTCELVNSSETVKTRYGYDAWGAPTERKLVGNVSTRYQFTGTEYCGTIALGISRGGWYSPVEARRLTSAVVASPPGSRAVTSHLYSFSAPVRSLQQDCVDHCDANHDDCFDECEYGPQYGQKGCDRSWTLGPWARCCQCWYKRCFIACLEGWGGDSMQHPPAAGDNRRSVSDCPSEMCGASNYSFEPKRYEGDITLEAEYWAGQFGFYVIHARNVCASLWQIHSQWGVYWYTSPLAYRLLTPSGWCVGCVYHAATVNDRPDLAVPGRPGLRCVASWPHNTVYLNVPMSAQRTGEPCPKYIPQWYGIEGWPYFRGPRGSQSPLNLVAGGEVQLWNSCNRGY